MKKIYGTLLAIAALGFAACTDTESVVDNIGVTNGETPENAISFSSYMGKQKVTRAYNPQVIDTDGLKDASSPGFGVFAYYTGKQNYPHSGVPSTAAQEPLISANFMYNQPVTWSTDDDAKGRVNGDASGAWVYSPIKYWPNEVQNGAVDDQDDDTGNNPATGSNTYGGNVSFFAYAPYTDAEISTPTAGGIIAINGETTLADGNVKECNPTVQYQIAQGSSSGTTNKNVDLLWGTYYNTDKNVLNENNAGGNVYGNWPNSAYVYNQQMTPIANYKTNVNLTKQKTNGTVGFLFKHALAKIGGPQVGTTTNGLMAILDIDDFKGAETGGTKEDATIVTIKSITITNATSKTGEPKDQRFWEKATLDLATGHWQFDEAKDLSYQIGDENTTDKNAALNPLLAEPKHDGAHCWHPTDKYIQNVNVVATPNNWQLFYTSTSTGDVKGVLTTQAQNVYKDAEESPLFFFPGSKPDLNITIDYYVRTKDTHLKYGYSEVEQIITKRVTFTNAVEMNKQYNLLMHIGLTSVKFTATVSNWDEDASGDGNVDDLDIQDVYVPRNVSGYVINTTTPSDAANSDDATTTFTATAVCVDPANAQTTTLEVAPTSGENTASISDNTVTVTFDNANTTTEKKYVDVTVTAKVGTNVVATEVVRVYQSACNLTITDPTITAGQTVVNLVVTSPNSDLSGETISVTAVKGSDPITVTVGSATFNTDHTTIPVTLPAAAVADETYTFTVNVNDATKETSVVTVTAAP